MEEGDRRNDKKPRSANRKKDEDGSELKYLHNNIQINSEKQKSAQGSVFYVKWGDDPIHSKSDATEEELKRELVLKIYKQKDMKSYRKEISVLNSLEKVKIERSR